MSAHTPVLLREVVDALDPRAGAIIVDGTFGAGGYSRAILDHADCAVWGIDRDPEAVARGEELAKQYDGRLRVLHGRFGDMADLLAAEGVTSVDGVVLDLGVSSMQLDQAERGFSFRFDGPLDMRMNPEAGESAADVVNSGAEGDLAHLIYTFGEERHARRIARAIVAARAEGPIEGTAALAEIVRGAVPAAKGPQKIDPATRTFQALRIHVNDELGELDRGLAAAEQLLADGGRFAVVTFHSLEDRPVKRFFRDRSGGAPKGSRHLPAGDTGPAPTFSLLTRNAITPRDGEIEANPRARSAKLRAAVRTAAPAWPLEAGTA